MADQTIDQPPILDAQGNIQVHGRAGCALQLLFRDEAGQSADATGRLVFFEVASKFRRQLQPVAGQADQLQLVLSQGDVDQVAKTGSAFVFRDETGVVGGQMIPQVLWEGVISIRGFKDTPPA